MQCSGRSVSSKRTRLVTHCAERGCTPRPAPNSGNSGASLLASREPLVLSLAHALLLPTDVAQAAAGLSPNCIAVLSLAQAAALPPPSVAALNPRSKAALHASVRNAMAGAQRQRWAPSYPAVEDALKYTDDAIINAPPDVLENMYTRWPPRAWAALSPDAIGAVPPEVTQAWLPDVVALLHPEQAACVASVVEQSGAEGGVGMLVRLGIRPSSQLGRAFVPPAARPPAPWREGQAQPV